MEGHLIVFAAHRTGPVVPMKWRARLSQRS
jgi:hypothetical protein